MDWMLNGYQLRKRYKKFSIEYNKNTIEELAHEMGESHKHTDNVSVDNRPLR